MIFDTLRTYEAGQFYQIDLPAWYHQTDRLVEKGVEWHQALDRILECEHLLLTEEGSLGKGLEIRFWQSPAHGIFVLIESASGIVEQVLVLRPKDWLPFLATYITPLIAATAQAALAGHVHKLTNAFVSFARHGEGSHVDRYSGLSRIDRDNDDQYVKSMIFRHQLARRLKEDPA